MSAGDILLTIVIWLYKLSTSILPTEIGILPLNTFTGYLAGLENNLVYAFSGIAKFFPMDLTFVLISVVISGELILFGVKAGIFLVNIIRGSGA